MTTKVGRAIVGVECWMRTWEVKKMKEENRKAVYAVQCGTLLDGTEGERKIRGGTAMMRAVCWK